MSADKEVNEEDDVIKEGDQIMLQRDKVLKVFQVRKQR